MSKEAMKLALEALNNLIPIGNRTADLQDAAIKALEEALANEDADAEIIKYHEATITRLQEALAQSRSDVKQSTECVEQGEPVATITITQEGSTRTIDNHFADCVRDWPNGEYKLYTQPQQPKQEQGEPVAKVCHDLDGHIGWNPNLTELPDEGTELYTTPQPAQTKAEKQEPVATIDSLEQEIYENTREFVSLNIMEWLLNRLNTHQQPKREQLTDARLDDIYYCVEGGSNSLETWREQARAIEAAHGIKE